VTPAYAYGRVYAGTDDGRLRVLDPATGAVRRTAGTTHALVSSPTVAAGVVYVVSQARRAGIQPVLHAFHAKTLAELWETPVLGLGPESAGIGHAPIYARGTAFVSVDDVGTSETRVFAFDAATGAQRWVSDPLFTDVPGGQPGIMRGRIYLSISDGERFLAVLRSSDGRFIGLRPGGAGGTALGNGRGYSVALNTPALRAWRESPFAELFEREFADGPPALVNGVLFTTVPDFSLSPFGSGLAALDPRTGAELALLDPAAGEFGTHGLAVADAMVFTAHANRLRAYALGPS
jgi:outer membrane protein assembly factor BamB